MTDRPTRNQCAACDHKRHPDGGWCYMFREEPAGVCAKHTARNVQNCAAGLSAWERSWLGLPPIYTQHAHPPKESA